ADGRRTPVRDRPQGRAVRGGAVSAGRVSGLALRLDEGAAGARGGGRHAEIGHYPSCCDDHSFDPNSRSPPMLRLASSTILAVLVCVVGNSQPEGEKETVKVGILHSLTGTMADSEQPMAHAEMLAIQEINDAGGVLGKNIDAIARDCKSEFATTFPE